MRVQFLEDLVADPGVIGELYRWLGVDATVRPDELGQPVHVSDEPAGDLGEDLRSRMRAWYTKHDRELSEMLGRRAALARPHPGEEHRAMTDAPEIRFNVPALEGRELDYVRESLEGGHTSSGGPFSARAGELIAAATGAEEVLLTTSCTDRPRAERDAAGPRP